MKLKQTLLLTLSVLLLLTACSSTNNTEKEVDPNFIGDIEPIQLENIMCIRESFGNLKPLELEVYFIPRTNIIEAYFRDGINEYCILFEGNEREAFSEGIELYAKDILKYKEDPRSALPVRDSTRDNYYTEGTMSVSWGVIGLAHNNTTTFQTNYEYLEPNKPYLELMVESTKDSDEDTINSPVVRLYFSPTHLETLMEELSQERLVGLVREKEEEAFAF